MDATPQILPPSELRIVLALSRCGKSTAPQIARCLNGEISANTVQCLLRRLEVKGLVRTAKIQTQRLWDLARPQELNLLVEAEARHLLSKYDRDPTLIDALLRVLKEAS